MEEDIVAGFASFLSDIAGIYSFLLILQLILSNRLRPNGGNQSGNQSFDNFRMFLGQITGPYLGFFRKLFYKGGRLDLSPMWALVALSVFRGMMKLLAVTGRLTFGGVITIFYTTIWRSVLSPINIILIIVLIIRLNIERRIDPRSMQIKDAIDKVLNGVVFKIYTAFYKGRAVTDLRLIQTTLAVFAVLEIAGSIIGKVLEAFLL